MFFNDLILIWLIVKNHSPLSGLFVSALALVDVDVDIIDPVEPLGIAYNGVELIEFYNKQNLTRMNS